MKACTVHFYDYDTKDKVEFVINTERDIDAEKIINAVGHVAEAVMEKLKLAERITAREKQERDAIE